MRDINCNYMKPKQAAPGRGGWSCQQSAWPTVQMAKLNPGKYSGEATGAHMYQIITVMCLFCRPVTEISVRAAWR